LVIDVINAAIDSGWNVNYSVTLMIIAGDNNIGYDTGVGYPQGYSDLDADSFHVGFDYNNWLGAPVFHERHGNASGGGAIKFSHVGIWCHEIGHVIGSGFLGGLSFHPAGAAGDWSVMRTGYRCGQDRKFQCPGNFDPPAIISYGWAIPVLVDTVMLAESVDYVNDKSGPKDFYQFSDPAPSSNRMFIIENRQYTDFNYYLPEYHVQGNHGGLIFWEWNSPGSDDRTIRPGDNDFDDIGDPYWQDGDGGDPFPGFSDNRSISMITTPNTNIGSLRTGFAIQNISTTSNSMTANFYPNFWAGNIITNETWTDSRSPYVVGGTVTIQSSGTITIESNTIVLIDSALLISGGNLVRQADVTFLPDLRLTNGALLGQYPSLQTAFQDAISADSLHVHGAHTENGALTFTCNAFIENNSTLSFANAAVVLNGFALTATAGTISKGANVTFSPDIRLIQSGNLTGQYPSLASAIAAAQSGDEIHLASAYTLNTAVSVPGDVTLKITTTNAVTLNQKLTVLDGAELEVTANAEIIANTDIQIDGGGKLTIGAGAEFEFASGKELLVYGNIETNGTANAPVIFTSQSGSWDGIHLEDSGNDSEIQYCQIRDAAIGINLDSSSPEIKHCVFEDCDVAIYGAYTDSELEISDNEISGHSLYGIGLGHGEDPQILRNSITNGAGSNAYGIYLNMITNPTFSIYTLHENEIIGAGKYGVYLTGADISIRENLICNHTRDGIYATSSCLRMEFSGSGSNRIQSNARRGVYLTSSAFGLMGSTPHAENCINSNGQHNLYYSGSVLLEAMFNYWGGCPVNSGLFYGNIDYSNALCQCPANLNLAFSSNPGYSIPVEPVAAPADRDSLRLAVLGQAYKLYANHETRAALENFDWIITNFPESPEACIALRYMDRCYRQQKDPSAAENFLNNIASTTKFPDGELALTAKYILADRLVRDKDPQSALKYCFEISGSAKDSELAADALYDAWQIYYSILNDSENAKIVLDKFAGTFPKDDRIQLMELLTRKIEPTSGGTLDTLLAKPATESVESTPAAITDYQLYPAYPNPFNPNTSIGYQLPENGAVSLKIYNLEGQLVRTLVQSPQTAGFHQVQWDATDDAGNAVAAGIYLCQMQAGVFRQTQRLVLLK
jgi:hypothetical protein